MKKIYILIASIISTVILTSACSHGNRGESGDRMSSPKMIFRIADDLDLTDEQEDKVDALMDRMKDLRSSMKEDGDNNSPLEAGFKKESYDKAAIETAMAERQAKRVDSRNGMVDIMEELHGILTPEQRAELVEIATERQRSRR